MNPQRKFQGVAGQEECEQAVCSTLSMGLKAWASADDRDVRHDRGEETGYARQLPRHALDRELESGEGHGEARGRCVGARPRGAEVQPYDTTRRGHQGESHAAGGCAVLTANAALV